jgi:hypothetical protein
VDNDLKAYLELEFAKLHAEAAATETRLTKALPVTEARLAENMRDMG